MRGSDQSASFAYQPSPGTKHVRRGESIDVTDLAEDGWGDDRTNGRDGQQTANSGVVPDQDVDLAHGARDLAGELIDEAHEGL